jgi:ADP-heptose:LPS heptosyltransferase
VPGARDAAPRRILIVRLGAFGDVVRTLPAAWALRRRHPESHLAWLVEPASAPLLRRLPWLDDVIEFPRPLLSAALAGRRAGELLRATREVRRGLREHGADCVVDFHGILKSGVLTRWTGAARRVGLGAPHAREGASFFYTERVPLASEPLPRWTRNAALAAHLGARVNDTEVPGLRRPRASDAELGPAVIHAGSSRGTPYKRYPIEQLAVVARELAGMTGVACRVTAGADPEERAQAKALVEQAGGAAVGVETGHDVDALIDELAGARLCVGGDTGPLHLASLLGTPVVQIMGPTHPVQNEPWPGTPWARAHLPLPCSPCRNGCSEAPCLGMLPVADVLAAVRRVWAQAELGAWPARQAAPGPAHAMPRHSEQRA